MQKFIRTILPILTLLAGNAYYKRNHGFSPMVHTESGPLKGVVSLSRERREFYEYLGIPYAKAPVGQLRFESPQPFGEWEGIFLAKSYGAICIQPDIFIRIIYGIEDCLFLNVFVPKVTTNKKLLPVMVWFHGGAFILGGAYLYKPDYFMDHDVILITINYRLGGLGFLNTGDGIARGNMGLKDQRMALKWIQTNIRNFSGDPNQVTIFGESAGAISVHHHLLSRSSSGLFQKAISQSGTAAAKWGTRSNATEQAKLFSRRFGCPTENSKAMLDCLRSINAYKLVESSYSDLESDLRDPITLIGPSIEYINDEDSVITELPYEIIRKGDFKSVPWMCGINAEEGLIFSTPLLHDSKLKKIRSNVRIHLPNVLWQHKRLSDIELYKIINFYFGKIENIDSADKFQNWTNLFTDALFAAPAQRAIIQQSVHSPVYAYYYSYKGAFTMTDLLLALPRLFPAALEYAYWFISRFIRQTVFGIRQHHYGACHFDEVPMQFPILIYHITKTHADYEMSKKMVKSWIEFASAKSEEEWESLNFGGVKWTLAIGKEEQDTRLESLKYMQIDTDAKMIDEPNPERNAFWNDLRL